MPGDNSPDGLGCEAGLVVRCGKWPTWVCQCCGLALCGGHAHPRPDPGQGAALDAPGALYSVLHGALWPGGQPDPYDGHRWGPSQHCTRCGVARSAVVPGGEPCR